MTFAGLSPTIVTRRSSQECRDLRGRLQGQASRCSSATVVCMAAVRSATRPSTTRLGRIMSYAGLVYAGDTTDPVQRQILRRRAGQGDEGVDRPSVLPARAQSRRRCGARCRGDRRTRALQALARRHAQGQAVPARRQGRAALPREERRPAPRPGIACSTRRWPALRFDRRRRGAVARAGPIAAQDEDADAKTPRERRPTRWRRG